jgi:hypothetical protein
LRASVSADGLGFEASVAEGGLDDGDLLVAGESRQVAFNASLYSTCSDISQWIFVLRANFFPESHKALMRTISLSCHLTFPDSTARYSIMPK